MKLILMLQDSKKKLTADQLAETFGVSRRTIFRDLRALSEVNVPVTWDEFSGYGVVSGYRIPPLMFTSKELATVLVGLNFVKSQVDKELVDDAKGVEIKIRNVLPDDLKQYMNSLDNRTVIDPFMYFGSEKKKGGSWYEISNAISKNKKIEFSYKSKSSKKYTIRVVDPYLLVFYKDHWNMIGFSEKREDIRNFVLDRITNLKILDQNFEPDREFDVQDLIFRSESTSQIIRVDIEEDAFDRFKANLPTKILNISELKPNKFRIELKFENLDYINEWLLQFGKRVKVISPDELIEKRKSIINQILDNI